MVEVLHVDDEPGFADTTAAFLEREDEDIVVDTETSAEDALERLLKDGNEYDCVVSDYDMPDTDGIKLLGEVREKYRSLPFVLFTGRGSEEVAAEALNAGATSYVEKGTPDTYEYLAERILEDVENARAKKKSERYATVIDALEEPVYILDEEGSFSFVNGHFEDLFGYDAETLRGKPPRFIKTDESVERAERNLGRVLSEDGPDKVRFEFEGVTKDGETVVCEDYLTALPYEGEQFRGSAGVAHDITGRKEREDILERKEDLFRRTQRLAEVGAWEYDVCEDNLIWTEGVYGIFGVPKGVDVSPERSMELVCAEDRPDIREAFENAAEEGEGYDKEAKIDTPDGETRWIRVRGEPQMEDGEVMLVRGTVRDVTERKERERELGRYEALVENTSDMVTLIDEEGEILYQSPSVERVLGYPYDTAVGENVFEYIHPGHRDSMRDKFSSLVKEDEEELREAEYRFLRSDGGYVWLEGTVADRRDTELDGFVVVSRDITDRKEHEKELQRKNERLKEFASIVSHDLHNPLAVAKGRLELAREGGDENLTEAKDALERMETLIDDVLELAREGERVSETERVDLDEAAYECWRNVETDSADLITRSDMSVEADRSRLKQMLENLIGNAVEHGSGGRTGSDDAVENGSSNGESPKSHHRNGNRDKDTNTDTDTDADADTDADTDTDADEDNIITVEVGTLEDGTGFYVADDGRGIPENEREDVFESGYSGSGDGTGFGLSTTKGISEAHGWDIKVVESSEGGARFEVTGVECEVPYQQRK